MISERDNQIDDTPKNVVDARSISAVFGNFANNLVERERFARKAVADLVDELTMFRDKLVELGAKLDLDTEMTGQCEAIIKIPNGKSSEILKVKADASCNTIRVVDVRDIGQTYKLENIADAARNILDQLKPHIKTEGMKPDSFAPRNG